MIEVLRKHGVVGVWGIEWNGKCTKGIRWGGVPLIVAWITLLLGL